VLAGGVLFTSTVQTTLDGYYTYTSFDNQYTFQEVNQFQIGSSLYRTTKICDTK
jgi:hypothetical protein